MPENSFRGLQALRSVFLNKTKTKTQCLFELQSLFVSSQHQRARKTLWWEADFPVVRLVACPWLMLIQLVLTPHNPGTPPNSEPWASLYTSGLASFTFQPWGRSPRSVLKINRFPCQEDTLLCLILSTFTGR